MHISNSIKGASVAVAINFNSHKSIYHHAYGKGSLKGGRSVIINSRDKRYYRLVDNIQVAIAA
jgi:hypothetical protein